MRSAGPGGRRARAAGSSAGSSFHYSFGILPRDQRRGIESFYAFCRVIDDLADEGAVHDRETGPGGPAAAGERAAALGAYRDEVARCYAGAPTRPVTRALQETIRRFAIPREPIEALIDGVEMDLYKTRYADFGELRLYCTRVASAVGLVCLAIFGCRDPRSRDYAIDLGIALQLTNILRDIRADALRGRLYLPLDEIRGFGCSEEDLIAGRRTSGCLALLRHQIARADRHFASAARALPEADRRRLVAAEVMGAIYRRVLARIAADPFRVFDGPVRVSRLAQIGVALRARLTGHIGH